jgi:hypothetical protein
LVNSLATWFMAITPHFDRYQSLCQVMRYIKVYAKSGLSRALAQNPQIESNRSRTPISISRHCST